MSKPLENTASCRRNPEKTRQTLLRHAFEQIHQQGFRAVSLDAILRDTGVTKGALYHHFPNKQALGYAVVDEVVAGILQTVWIDPVVNSDDPVTALQDIIRLTGENMSLDELKLGCPLNNLSQEMSALDEGFRLRLDKIYENWRTSLSAALENGINRNTVVSNIDPDTTAAFLVAALEGCIGMAKNAQSMRILDRCGAGILSYLESLRPAREQPMKADPKEVA